jgi:hypothetical protein
MRDQEVREGLHNKLLSDTVLPYRHHYLILRICKHQVLLHVSVDIKEKRLS